MGMPRVFLDTADVRQIEDAVSTGMIDGIATNPEKIAQAGKSYRQVVAEIRRCFDGPIAVQAVGRTRDEICECARRLHQIDIRLLRECPVDQHNFADLRDAGFFKNERAQFLSGSISDLGIPNQIQNPLVIVLFDCISGLIDQ